MSENKQTPEAKDFEIIYFFIGCFIGLGFHIFYLTCWKIFTKKALEASPRLPVEEECGISEPKQVWEAGFWLPLVWPWVRSLHLPQLVSSSAKWA